MAEAARFVMLVTDSDGTVTAYGPVTTESAQGMLEHLHNCGTYAVRAELRPWSTIAPLTT